MKISYNLRWDPDTGTAYRQTVRITEEENKTLFHDQFSPGVNYGNADTGIYIASIIFDKPEYEKHIKRIRSANSIVFVGNGKIPVYGEKV